MPQTGGVQILNSTDLKPQSPVRRHSESFSGLARAAMLSNTATANSSTNSSTPSSPPSEPLLGPSAVPGSHDVASKAESGTKLLKPPPKTPFGRLQEDHSHHHHIASSIPRSLGAALTDTPLPSTPGSPHMYVKLLRSLISYINP